MANLTTIIDNIIDKVNLNTAKETNVSTNLSITTTSTTNTIVSSDGTDATLPAATTTVAGVMTAADKVKVNASTSNVGTITGVTAGAGLSGGGTSGAVTLNHADTSVQASINNSGRTYIQDITLDTYGHITGITSATETVVNTDTNTWRGIDDTPVNGQTSESISSNWAYDHTASSTAHPRDTRSQIAGTYDNYSSWTMKDSDGTSYSITSGDILQIVEGNGIDANFTADDVLTITNTKPNIVQTTVTGNAGTATKLATARTINGVSFNGEANITVADSTKLPLTGGTITGDLTLNSATPTINFNGTSDTGIDMAIRANPEGLDFYEPEDSDRIHFQILDDTGVNAPFGYNVGATQVIDSTGKVKKFPTLTLSGDVTGSATFTDLGNATLTTVIANDSHTHDGRYYTETEANARYAYKAGSLDQDFSVDTLTADNGINMTGGVFTNSSTDSYDKLRVWSSGSYSIGMKSGQTYGGLNDYAMTFTMNNDADRGFLFRDESDSSSDGAMSLTTAGVMKVKGTVTAPTFSGALSGTASNADKLDNLNSTEFLRSNVDDTSTGVLTLAKTGTQYPLIVGDTVGVAGKTGISFKGHSTQNGYIYANHTDADSAGGNYSFHLGSTELVTKVIVDNGAFVGDLDGNATTATTSTKSVVNGSDSGGTDYPLVWHNNSNTLYDSSYFKINRDEQKIKTPNLKVSTNLELGSSSEATIKYNATDNSIDFIIN